MLAEVFWPVWRGLVIVLRAVFGYEALEDT